MTGQNAPLVLLHGFAQSGASWHEVRDLLPAGRAIVAPELPGHGQTALSLGEPSPELARATIVAAIEAVGGPVVVWGYSQGARAAFDLVLEHPELVCALIIESGAPGIEDPVARAERRSRDYALSTRIEAGTIEEFVSTWELVPALGEQSSEVIEKQRPIRLSHDPEALAAALRGMGQSAYEPMWDRLGEISVPTLLVTGASDPTYGAHAERIAEAIPDAAHVTISGAGHAAHISQPESTVATVSDFLNALS